MLCPPTCVACEASVREADRALCPTCRSELSLILGTPCRRCGAPTVVDQPAYDQPAKPCVRCEGKPLRFDEVVAAGVYDGLLRELTLRAKSLANESVAVALGELVADLGAERLRRLRPDVVASVPMHWSRRLVRQTNGPELMAAAVADRLQTDCSPGLLVRKKRTVRQSKLARSQRADNLRRAFRLGRGYRLRGATVLLVDDILTTGATCSEAAAELKRAGAARVIAVVAARAL
ncbi:MAG: phosphoribosyltransferase family protein [Planctomycetota bacterium]